MVSGFFATQGMLLYVEVTGAMRTAAREALARVEASHLAMKTLDAMSTGEARRVLIARALVRRPRALVLDEPTTGLDVVARQRFLETVRVVARAGTTIILITHHVEEVIPEIGHVVLLHGGRVAAEGDDRGHADQRTPQRPVRSACVGFKGERLLQRPRVGAHLKVRGYVVPATAARHGSEKARSRRGTASCISPRGVRAGVIPRENPCAARLSRMAVRLVMTCIGTSHGAPSPLTSAGG